MNPEDMKEIGVPHGQHRARPVLVGRGDVQVRGRQIPTGMIFVPYGPPTCHLMGQYTDGTGMPLSKGWEVEVELLEAPAPAAPVPAPVDS